MNMKLIEHKREQARYVCIERNAEMSGIQKKKHRKQSINIQMYKVSQS